MNIEHQQPGCCNSPYVKQIVVTNKFKYTYETLDKGSPYTMDSLVYTATIGDDGVLVTPHSISAKSPVSHTDTSTYPQCHVTFHQLNLALTKAQLHVTLPRHDYHVTENTPAFITLSDIHTTEFKNFCTRHNLKPDTYVYQFYMSIARGILFPKEIDSLYQAEKYMGILDVHAQTPHTPTALLDLSKYETDFPLSLQCACPKHIVSPEHTNNVWLPHEWQAQHKVCVVKALDHRFHVLRPQILAQLKSTLQTTKTHAAYTKYVKSATLAFMFAFMSTTISFLLQQLLPTANAQLLDNQQDHINGVFIRNGFLYDPMSHHVHVNPEMIHFIRKINTTQIHNALLQLEQLQKSTKKLCTEKLLPFNAQGSQQKYYRALSKNYFQIEGAYTWARAKYLCSLAGAIIASPLTRHQIDELYSVMATFSIPQIWAGFDIHPAEGELMSPDGQNAFVGHAWTWDTACLDAHEENEWEAILTYYKIIRYNAYIRMGRHTLEMCPQHSDKTHKRLGDPIYKSLICQRQNTTLATQAADHIRNNVCTYQQVLMDTKLQQLKAIIPLRYPSTPGDRIFDTIGSLKSLDDTMFYKLWRDTRFHRSLSSDNDKNTTLLSRKKRAWPILLIKGFCGIASAIATVIQAAKSVNELQNPKQQNTVNKMVRKIPSVPQLTKLEHTLPDHVTLEYPLNSMGAVLTVADLKWTLDENLQIFLSIAETVQKAHYFVTNLHENEFPATGFPGITQQELQRAKEILAHSTQATLSTNTNDISVAGTFSTHGARLIVYSVPLLAYEDLAIVYKTVPIPLYANNSMYLAQPQSQFLAVFLQSQRYALLTPQEARDCIKGPHCITSGPIYTSGNKACGATNFYYNAKVTCPLEDMAQQRPFVYTTRNLTIYKVPRKTKMSIECYDYYSAQPGSDRHVEIENLGYITMDPTCRLTTNATFVKPDKRFSIFRAPQITQKYTVTPLKLTSLNASAHIRNTNKRTYFLPSDNSFTLSHYINIGLYATMAFLFAAAILTVCILYKTGKCKLTFAQTPLNMPLASMPIIRDASTRYGAIINSPMLHRTMPPQQVSDEEGHSDYDTHDCIHPPQSTANVLALKD